MPNWPLAGCAGQLSHSNSFFYPTSRRSTIWSRSLLSLISCLNILSGKGALFTRSRLIGGLRRIFGRAYILPSCPEYQHHCPAPTSRHSFIRHLTKSLTPHGRLLMLAPFRYSFLRHLTHPRWLMLAPSAVPLTKHQWLMLAVTILK